MESVRKTAKMDRCAKRNETARKEDGLRHTIGYRRHDRRKAGKRAAAGPGARREDGERALYFLGILGIAIMLALPLNRAGGSAADEEAGSRAAVAVISRAAEDIPADYPAQAEDPAGSAAEKGNPIRDLNEKPAVSAERESGLSVSVGTEESVFDGIGRFFARLLTGG